MAVCISVQALACAATAVVSAPSVSGPCTVSSTSAAAGSSTRWGRQLCLKATVIAHPLHQSRSASHIARQAAVAELSDFAVQESAKFREGLLQQLSANETTASAKVKIADVCTKVFGDYLDKYDGTLSPAPFGQMKDALDGEKLPGSEVAICAALGWARGHLHHDWKMSKEEPKVKK